MCYVPCVNAGTAKQSQSKVWRVKETVTAMIRNASWPDHARGRHSSENACWPDIGDMRSQLLGGSRKTLSFRPSSLVKHCINKIYIYFFFTVSQDYHGARTNQGAKG